MRSFAARLVGTWQLIAARSVDLLPSRPDLAGAASAQLLEALQHQLANLLPSLSHREFECADSTLPAAAGADMHCDCALFDSDGIAPTWQGICASFAEPMSALDEQATFLGGVTHTLLLLPPASAAAHACVTEILERCAATLTQGTSLQSLRDAGSSALLVAAICMNITTDPAHRLGWRGVADWSQMMNGVDKMFESLASFRSGSVVSDDLSRSHAFVLRAKFLLSQCSGSVHSQENWAMLLGVFGRIDAIGGCYTSHATAIAVEWLHELLKTLPMSCAERISVADQLPRWHLPSSCPGEMHHALTEAVMNSVGGRTDVFLDERVQLFAHTAGALAMQIRCQLEAVPSTDDHWDLRLQQSYCKFTGLLSAASSAGVSSPRVRTWSLVPRTCIRIELWALFDALRLRV